MEDTRLCFYEYSIEATAMGLENKQKAVLDYRQKCQSHEITSQNPCCEKLETHRCKSCHIDQDCLPRLEHCNCLSLADVDKIDNSIESKPLFESQFSPTPVHASFRLRPSHVVHKPQLTPKPHFKPSQIINKRTQPLRRPNLILKKQLQPLNTHPVPHKPLKLNRIRRLDIHNPGIPRRRRHILPHTP